MVNSNGFLWQKNDFEVAKCLKQDSDNVITRLDKGAGVVILNRTDYITKMVTILDDTTKFLKIGDLSFDDTHKLKIKLQPIGSQRPRMYGLPKIHKSDIPLRSILSISHSIQHSLAKWLIQVLNRVSILFRILCG